MMMVVHYSQRALHPRLRAERARRRQNTSQHCGQAFAARSAETKRERQHSVFLYIFNCTSPHFDLCALEYSYVCVCVTKARLSRAVVHPPPHTAETSGRLTLSFFALGRRSSFDMSSPAAFGRFVIGLFTAPSPSLRLLKPLEQLLQPTHLHKSARRRRPPALSTGRNRDQTCRHRHAARKG